MQNVENNMKKLTFILLMLVLLMFSPKTFSQETEQFTVGGIVNLKATCYYESQYSTSICTYNYLQWHSQFQLYEPKVITVVGSDVSFINYTDSEETTITITRIPAHYYSKYVFNVPKNYKIF